MSISGESGGDVNTVRISDKLNKIKINENEDENVLSKISAIIEMGSEVENLIIDNFKNILKLHIVKPSEKVVITNKFKIGNEEPHEYNSRVQLTRHIIDKFLDDIFDLLNDNESENKKTSTWEKYIEDLHSKMLFTDDNKQKIIKIVKIYEEEINLDDPTQYARLWNGFLNARTRALTNNLESITLENDIDVSFNIIMKIISDSECFKKKPPKNKKIDKSTIKSNNDEKPISHGSAESNINEIPEKCMSPSKNLENYENEEKAQPKHLVKNSPKGEPTVKDKDNKTPGEEVTEKKFEEIQEKVELEDSERNKNEEDIKNK